MCHLLKTKLLILAVTAVLRQTACYLPLILNIMSWIKIDKKGKNLPKKDCNCWLRIKEDSEFHIVLGKYNSAVGSFYWHKENDVTHYFIIEKPQFP